MNEFVAMLATSQHFGIVLGMGGFLLGRQIYKRTGWMLLNPILIMYIVVAVVLLVFDLDVEKFRQDTSMMQYVLQVSTVCLAVPLYRQFEVLKQNYGVILGGIAVGTMSALTSVFVLCKLFGIEKVVFLSIVAKSVTTPVATGISQEIGGIAAITVISVISSGVIGTVLCQSLFKWFKITDRVAIGLAIGTSAHALGTTKAIEIGDTEGAMSSLSIVVAACMTAALAPIIAPFF